METSCLPTSVRGHGRKGFLIRRICRVLPAGGLLPLLVGCLTFPNGEEITSTIAEPSADGQSSLSTVEADRTIELVPAPKIGLMTTPAWASLREKPNPLTHPPASTTPSGEQKVRTEPAMAPEGEIAANLDAEPNLVLVPEDHEFSQMSTIRGERWPLVFNKGAMQAYNREEGIGSYYWGKQKLACGDWYNPEALTAAHRTLPFGTIVRVTLVKTGRSVVVMINDRGPFIKKRVIDLSVAAARKVGLAGRGTGKCVIEVLAYPLVESMGPKGNG